MVLLTMTDAIVKALESTIDPSKLDAQDTGPEPILSEPAIGKPISHSQIIAIYRQMKNEGHPSHHLETLLRGSRLYVAPPPAKLEPSPEYKALMSRLRREEESRAYERMINPLPPHETFSQRFPATSSAYAFSSTAAYSSAQEDKEDDIMYADVNRQVTLIFNVLVSVVACAGAIWMAARWWDTPARVALSMSGSFLVGIAEVVVYSGYLRRLGDARRKEGGVREVKEIVKTWVIGGDKDKGEKEIIESTLDTGSRDEHTLRERKLWNEPSG